jgi:predicted DsbA family dithiol-disulfide isomerase
MSASSEKLTIDVVSDVVCPWCYVGKRRLEAALLQLTADEPTVRPFVSWHPFQLNPQLPREGIERRAYLDAKFGGTARADQIYDRVRAAGASVDIPFAFERIVRQPNTRDAHRLISWAQRQGDADALVEQLFRAYFIDGRAIGDHGVLAAIAGEAGFDVSAARVFLASDEGGETIVAMDRRVRELGIGGVPFFIFNERVSVSGAQEPATLLDAIGQAREPVKL